MLSEKSIPLAQLTVKGPVTLCAFQFLLRDKRYDNEKPYYFSGPLLPEQEGHLTDEEAEKYLSGTYRVRILNCWRPFFNSADERPLTMCDYSSTSALDLKPADRVSREYVGEIYYLQYDENQRWYWISGQTPEELLLFVNYDSDPQGGPPFMAHSAFINEAIGRGVKPRQSLKMALIVVNKKEQ